MVQNGSKGIKNNRIKLKKGKIALFLVLNHKNKFHEKI